MAGACKTFLKNMVDDGKIELLTDVKLDYIFIGSFCVQ